MKFNRKKSADATAPGAGEPAAAAEAAPAAAPLRPRDVSEVDIEADGVPRVDLGGLLIAPVEQLEVRMQVEESSGQVQAVLFAGSDGAVEIRAFAAARGDAMWEEVRPKVAADAARQGGTASEVDGVWGRELICRITQQLPDGAAGIQESRIVGVDGPRWFVRATMVGAPVHDEAARAPYDEALRSLVVRRGSGAMSPGEPLPMTVPASARRAGA